MINFDILYEDSDILVLNKSEGVVVNTSATTKENTIQDALIQKFSSVFLEPKPSKTSDNQQETDFYARAGIVHRLDKDTSGILIAAKNEKSFASLQKQFKDRSINKEYIALINGKLEDDVIEINASIKRHPVVRTKFAIGPEGKESFTRIEKIKDVFINGENLTLVRVLPKTGRTHQIRVHLSAINHPIIGDTIYMSKKTYNYWLPQFRRLMLHAHKIEFLHPSFEKRVQFEASLPKEFEQF